MQTYGVSLLSVSLGFTSVHISRAWFSAYGRIYFTADTWGFSVSAAAGTAGFKLVFISVIGWDMGSAHSHCSITELLCAPSAGIRTWSK